jgi:mRNA interferase HigB
MNVISRRRLQEFWARHHRAKAPLSIWFKIVSKATWATPEDIKEAFGANVDFVGDSRVIFDIGGNKYRVVARIAYAPYNRVMIKFVGTHQEYNKIDAESV